MTFVCLTAIANLADALPTVCTFFPRFRQPVKPRTFCLALLYNLFVCVFVGMQNTRIFCAVIPTGIINYPSAPRSSQVASPTRRRAVACAAKRGDGGGGDPNLTMPPHLTINAPETLPVEAKRAMEGAGLRCDGCC